jgi:hypothetical protein
MRRRRAAVKSRSLFFAVLVVLLLLPGPGLAAGQRSSRSQAPQVDIKHGQAVTPVIFRGNVRDLPTPARGTPSLRREHEEPDPAAAKLQASPTAVAVPRASVPAPAPSQSFKGLDFQNWGAGWPPDTVGDVGPNHYVQAVNTSIGIFNKTGVRLAAFTFDTFWSGTGTACDDDNQGDPTVVYDPMADRWIVADFAFAAFAPPFYECIAVSRTGDPVAGGWYMYAVRADDATHPWLHDYPKMGIWPDGLYMTANEFDTSENFKGVRVWALNRGDLESGSPLRSVIVDIPFVNTTAYSSLLPSNMRGTPPPAGRPNLLISESNTVYAFHVWKFRPDYAGGGTTFTGPTNVSQTQYTVATSTVPSPGNPLDSLRERLMMQAQYRNIGGTESLWVNHTVRTGNLSTSANGIQWAQIDVTGGIITLAPVQQQIYGNVGGDNVHRWMGSLAVDKDGNLALGYSASSSTLNPDIRYAGRLATDPLNTLPQGETTMLPGVVRGTQSGSGINRWGDYSAMSVDPVDDCTFWYTQEYYETTGLNWQTRIGSFKYPSCTGTPPPPVINWAANPSVDFDGDRKTDMGGLYRGLSPADSLWFALSSSGGGPFQIFFGATTDVPVPGDYNGDGKTDAVIFRPQTGLWYGPQTGAAVIVIQMNLGQAGDIPIPGDYDGDGKTDPAIWRPSTGLFFAVLSGGGTKSSSFGVPTDVPVPRDYDGDGKTDFAIYRQDATPDHLGLWYSPLSGGGLYQIYFGAPGDVPVPGDYNGDTRAEAVINREATGLWYGPFNGAPGLFQLLLGGPGDVPIPGYYDNNLSVDPAIYHKANGLWFALLSGGGVARVDGLGLPTDVPVQKRPTLAGGL